MKKNNYVCHPCGLPYLTPDQREWNRISTWQEGTCSVCGERTSVTHKRAYNYLENAVQNESLWLNIIDLKNRVSDFDKMFCEKLEENLAGIRGYEEENTCVVIGQDDEDYFASYPETSCCHVGPITDENYCPKCGAKIEKDEEE